MKCPKCHSDNPETSRFCAECGTQIIPAEEISVSPTKTLETPKEELTTGSTFTGRYQIIEELGKGGMGNVYRVLDKKLNEEVALKLIKPEISSDKKTIARFSNELKLARKISHRNVGRMYELMEEKGTHFITMEYVPGEDLKSFVRRAGPLSAGKTIFIANQVCEGLAEAHRLGVVHRDLKPQNIMIDKEGNARIMDFGIARSLKAKGITGAGVMIGTPEYMSPEQVEGKEADQRSDIYSLGVILYEMVTGRVPFEGDTPFTIGVKQKSEKPRDPKELNTQVPSDLSQVILRCLEKDKGKRYQSAEEVRSELTKIEKGIPTTEKVIPKRKPITSREITVTFGLKKLFIPVLVVAALVIAAVLIWQLLPRKEAIPTVISDKPSLAVMYFENNSRDKSLDNWRDALAEMLITDLSQSKFLHVVSADRTYSLLKKLNLLDKDKYSTEELKKAAKEGRVGHVLNGSYITAGDKFIINVSLLKADTGDVISSLREEGIGEESITESIDRITKRIKTELNISPAQIASDIDREVGKITTSSPEALKYFNEGSRYYRTGESRKAIDYLEKALAIDPDFAMAYRNMAGAYANLGYPTKYREYRQKAFALSDRVTDRERYRIQGDFYQRLPQTRDKAIEAFQKLLELYPDDWIGNNLLGNLYWNLEEWEKAQKLYEVNVKNRVDAYQSYSNLASVYEYKGLYEKAKEVLDLYIDNIADNARIRRSLAYNYLRQGKYDLALAELDKAAALSPSIYQIIMDRGDIQVLKGDLAQAEEEYQRLMIESEPMARIYCLTNLCSLYLLQGRFQEAIRQLKLGAELAERIGERVREWQIRDYLAYAYWKSGHYEKALEEEDKIWRSLKEDDLSWQRTVLYHKGLVFSGKNALDEIEKMADELKSIIEKGMNQNLMREYYHLLGFIELKQGNFSASVELLEKTLDLFPYFQSRYLTSLYIEPLALAYYKKGDLDKAQESYEKIISLNLGRINFGDIYAKSFYMLGKIYEQKAWKGKAIEHYQKFLDLWEDADPGFAEVEDSKKRLSALQE